MAALSLRHCIDERRQILESPISHGLVDDRAYKSNISWNIPECRNDAIETWSKRRLFYPGRLKWHSTYGAAPVLIHKEFVDEARIYGEWHSLGLCALTCCARGTLAIEPEFWAILPGGILS
jgi:hypothetical protein